MGGGSSRDHLCYDKVITDWLRYPLKCFQNLIYVGGLMYNDTINKTKRKV